MHAERSTKRRLSWRQVVATGGATVSLALAVVAGAAGHAGAAGMAAEGAAKAAPAAASAAGGCGYGGNYSIYPYTWFYSGYDRCHSGYGYGYGYGFSYGCRDRCDNCHDRHDRCDDCCDGRYWIQGYGPRRDRCDDGCGYYGYRAVKPPAKQSKATQGAPALAAH